MELKHLQYFTTTVHAGSITKAAEILYITQPALSRLLRRLEDELGFPLFERKHSGLILTPGGQEIFRCAEHILDTLEESVRSAKQIAGLDEDTISIACAFEEFDNQLIFQFQQHYPTIRTRFSVLPPQQALKQLLADEVGFAVLPRMELPESLKWMPLMKEEMMLSVGKDHPLANRTEVSIEELSGCSIVCNEVSFDEGTLQQICRAHNIQLNVSFCGNDHHQVGILKHLMNSIMFIPTSALLEQRELDQDGLKRYGAPKPPARVDPRVFHREIGVAFREHRVMRSADLFLITSLKNHYRDIETQVIAYLDRLDT